MTGLPLAGPTTRRIRAVPPRRRNRRHANGLERDPVNALNHDGSSANFRFAGCQGLRSRNHTRQMRRIICCKTPRAAARERLLRRANKPASTARPCNVWSARKRASRGISRNAPIRSSVENGLGKKVTQPFPTARLSNDSLSSVLVTRTGVLELTFTRHSANSIPQLSPGLIPTMRQIASLGIASRNSLAEA